MVANTVSTRHFRMKPNPNGSWHDIQPNFGVIKGLHLEYLEFPHKVKKNAPLIPDPTYSGKALEDPPNEPAPPPVSGKPGKTPVSEPEKRDALTSVEKSHSRETSRDDGTSSRESEYASYEEEDSQEDAFAKKFAGSPKATPDPPKKRSEKKEKKRISVPKEPEPVEEEEVVHEKQDDDDPTQVFIREEVERRMNIATLKKIQKQGGVEIGAEVDDDMDLQTSRILMQTTATQLKHDKSVSLNKFGLVGVFLGVEQGCSMFTNKMKDYLKFQMSIMHVYDDLLEEIGPNQITSYLQDLDPTLQLGGVVALTTAGFFIMQNYVGEDKVKGANLIKAFFPDKAKIIDDITDASKKVKKEKKTDKKSASREPTPKKRRGPSYKAEDINNAN